MNEQELERIAKEIQNEPAVREALKAMPKGPRPQNVFYPQTTEGTIDKARWDLPLEMEALTKPLPTDNGAPVPIQTHKIPIRIELFGEPASIIFSFDVPKSFDAEGLKNALRSEITIPLKRFIKRINEELTPDAQKVTDVENNVEMVLVPGVGSVARHSGVPYFRYRIHIQRTSGQEGDLYVGDDAE